MVELVLPAHDLAARDRVEVRDREMRVNAARSSSDLPVHTGDDLLPGAEQLQKDRHVLPAPGLLQALKEPTDRGASEARSRPIHRVTMQSCATPKRPTAQPERPDHHGPRHCRSGLPPAAQAAASAGNAARHPTAGGRQPERQQSAEVSTRPAVVTRRARRRRRTDDESARIVAPLRDRQDCEDEGDGEDQLRSR